MIRKHIRSTLAINPEAYSAKSSANRWASFGYALAGLLHMLRYAKNIRIQAIATIFVIGLGIWLRLDRIEWAVITLIITLNWLAEFMNAAIEATVNMVSSEYHPMAQVAKDVAAASVLIATAGSIIIGGLVLAPPLLERLL